MRIHDATPSAASFMESLRDIGYSIETAVADILDNSITARATDIRIFLDDVEKSPKIAIIDNGHGMTEDELLLAMKPGSKNPLDSRDSHDLGRFGLGLKIASFSQCRKLTVVTKCDGKLNAALWDIDFVASKDEWSLQVLDEREVCEIPYIDQIPESGTLVFWEKLDRLGQATRATKLSDYIYESFDLVRKHIELTFHRFLDGEKPYRKIHISINGEPLVAFDPFNSKNIATIIQPEEVIQLHDAPVVVQPYVLPHHKKVSATEWEKYAGEVGYLKNQGFYVYRAGRLIIYGTWFKLARQAELTKLSRVRVDIPNALDHLWKIDVKKASAQPPLIVRERLKKIIDRIGGASNKVYTQRGRKLVDPNVSTIWARRADKNEIIYEIDTDHPAIKGFLSSLTSEQEKRFQSILKSIGGLFPVDSLYQDIASHAEKIVAQESSKESLRPLLELTCELYREQDKDITEDQILGSLRTIEPFRSNLPLTEEILAELTQGEN